MPRIALIAAVLLALSCRTPARAVETACGFPWAFGDPCVDAFGLTDSCCEPMLCESPLEATYVTVDMVAFLRDWQASQTFATLDTPTNPVLGTHNLVFAYQPGLRLLVGRQFDQRRAIEASFIGILQWNEVRAVADSTVNTLGTAGNLFSPFSGFGDPALVGFDYNNFASIRSISSFNNVEINLRQQLPTASGCIQASGLAGVRYINVRDQFVYQTRSLEPVAPGTDNMVDVLARNSMIGVQGGGALDFRIERRAWLSFEGKLLLLGNGSSQQTAFTTGPLVGASTTVTGARSQSRVTLGADLAGTFLWKLGPSFIVRAGYQAIFLDGLALGANNFLRNVPVMTTNPNELSQNGRLAFHGPFAGLTLTW